MLPLIIPALAVAGVAYFIFKEDKENDDKQLAKNAGDKRSGGGDNTTDNERTPKEGLTPAATSENDYEASISGADIETDLNESDTENEHEVSG